MFDIQVGREGDPLGGSAVLPTETEGWDENKSKLFPLGQWIDCNQDSPPDKMLPLCSAPCVFIPVLAVRPFIQFSSTWHGFSAKCKVLPSCRGELHANSGAKALGVHTHKHTHIHRVCLLRSPSLSWGMPGT